MQRRMQWREHCSGTGSEKKNVTKKKEDDQKGGVGKEPWRNAHRTRCRLTRASDGGTFGNAVPSASRTATDACPRGASNYINEQ